MQYWLIFSSFLKFYYCKIWETRKILAILHSSLCDDNYLYCNYRLVLCHMSLNILVLYANLTLGSQSPSISMKIYSSKLLILVLKLFFGLDCVGLSFKFSGWSSSYSSSPVQESIASYDNCINRCWVLASTTHPEITSATHTPGGTCYCDAGPYSLNIQPSHPWKAFVFHRK